MTWPHGHWPPPTAPRPAMWPPRHRPQALLNQTSSPGPRGNSPGLPCPPGPTRAHLAQPSYPIPSPPGRRQQGSACGGGCHTGVLPKRRGEEGGGGHARGRALHTFPYCRHVLVCDLVREARVGLPVLPSLGLKPVPGRGTRRRSGSGSEGGSCLLGQSALKRRGARASGVWCERCHAASAALQANPCAFTHGRTNSGPGSARHCPPGLPCWLPGACIAGLCS